MSVGVTVFLPADPLSQKIGGIQSFVRDFVRFAPDDFDIAIVGVTADRAARPVGRWTGIELDGRVVDFLAVTAIADVHRRQRIPVALTYTAGLVRFRRRIPTAGRVLQFHRAGVPLALIGRLAAAIQVVHLNVADIYREAGESRWRRLPGMYHRVEDLTIGRMKRVFVVNEAGVDFYRRRHPRLAARVSFMSTWFDDTQFKPPPAARRRQLRTALASELGLSADDRLVLFVGRLERQKDPDLLIDSFAAELTADPTLRLLIVGEGGLRTMAEAHAASSAAADARIHFLGYRSRPEVAGLMAAADALLLASRFEGMPITVLEALASGLPVASTDVGEVRRVVRDGESGALAVERTPAALAAALGAVLAGGAGLRRGAAAAAAPYAASNVLGPFYQAHRDALADAA